MAVFGDRSGVSGPDTDPDRTDVLPLLAAGSAAAPPVEEPTVSVPWAVPAGVAGDPTEQRLLRDGQPLSPDAADAALLAQRDATIAALEVSHALLAAELESLRQLVPAADAAAELEPLRTELAVLRVAVAEHEQERRDWRVARDAAFADVQRMGAVLALAEASLIEVRGELATARVELSLAPATLAAGAAAIVEPTLIPLEGAPVGVYRLGQRTRIGRGYDNELRLDAPSISRHHAILIVSLRGTFLEDLSSVNGVYVNRKRVRRARLADGDVVALGSISFRYSGPLSAGD